VDAGEAVSDSGVTCDLTGADLRVGILGLDDELYALDRSGKGLGDGSRDTTGGEINQKIGHGCMN